MVRLLLFLLAGALAARPDVAPQPVPVTYEAFALRFGILPAFPVSGLVADADQSRTIDVPVMVWLLKGSNGRRVLIDSGFYRQKFVDRWKVREFRTPAAASEAAGVKPDAAVEPTATVSSPGPPTTRVKLPAPVVCR